MDNAQIGWGIALLAAATALVWVVVNRLTHTDRENARFVQGLFLAAVLLRAVVAVGDFLYLPYGALAPDEAGYVFAAKGLLASGSVNVGAAVTGHGWIYFNLLLFHAFGVNPLLPRLWNCLVGGLAPVLCFALARRLGAGRAARWSAILAAFFPSLLVWSTLDLKDADVYFLVLAGLLLVTQLRDGVALLMLRIAGFGLVLLTLFSLRQFAAELLATSAAVALVAASRPARWLGDRAHPWRTFGAPIAGLVVLGLIVGVLFPRVGTSMYTITGLGQLAHLRHEFGLGARSVTNPDPGIGTLAGALTFLPSGIVDFMLRPFPWEPGSELAVLTRPETILYYVLLLLAGLGILVGLRRTPAVALPLVTYLVIGMVGYGLVISNLGTLYRERAPLVLVLFVFVGLAIGALRPPENERGPTGSAESAV